MKGRVTVLPTRERIARSIVDLCRQAQTSNKSEVRSTTYEMAYNELVRENMREMARESVAFYGKDELSRMAIERTDTELDMQLEEAGITYDREGLSKSAKKDLKRTGKELQRLSRNLADSKRSKRVRESAEIRRDSAEPFSLHQIGLEGFPTGLLVKPVARGSQVLDFDKVRSRLGCETLGEWFPVEAYMDGHVFVIDDDGSVFVSVDGLPPDKVQEAEELLRHFADALYV